MRKRNIRFSLLLKDNKPVRTLEELQRFYDNEKIFQYFQNGQLSRWLDQRGYEKELIKIEELKKVDEEFLKSSLQNILINSESHISTVENKEGVEEESLCNLSKRHSIVSRNEFLNNKEEISSKDRFIQKDLKDTFGISDSLSATNRNHEKFNEEDLNFEETNLYGEVVESEEENIEVSLGQFKQSHIKHGSMEEDKIKLGNKIKEEDSKEDSNETLVSVEKVHDNKLNTPKLSLNIGSHSNVPSESRKGLSNGIDFTSINKSHGNSSFEDLKGKSLIKENQSKLNLNIGLDKLNPLNSLNENMKEYDSLDKKNENLNKTLEGALEKPKENNIHMAKEETIDSNISEDNSSVKNNNDGFDVDKIGEFISDPKIVDMLKEYYMSNKNIQLKCKTNKNCDENTEKLDFNKESKVIPLNHMKSENKEALIGSKLNKDKSLQNNLNKNTLSSFKNDFDKINLNKNDFDKINSKTLEDSKKNISSIKDNKDHKMGGMFAALFKKNQKIEEHYEEKKSNLNVNKNINIRGVVTVSSTEEYLNAMQNRVLEDEVLEVKVSCSNLEVEDKYKNIKYIGNSNSATVILKGEYLFRGRENGISFSNLNITSHKKINFTAEKLEGCLVNKKMVKKDISDLLQKHPNILAKVEECNYLKEESHKTVENNNYSLESFIKRVYNNENDFSEIIGTVKYEGVSIFANVNMGMIDMAFYKTEDNNYEDISHVFQNMECMDIFKRDSDIGLLLKALISKEDLKELENIKGKTYNGPKDAIWDLFKENKIEEYLQYIMLMPIKIFKQGMPLNRKEQIRIIELMNIDTGIPFLYRAFSGKRNTVEKDLFNFIEEASLNRDNYNVSFKGVVVEVLDQELRETLGVTDGKSNFETYFKFKSCVYKSRVKDVKFTLDEEFRLLPIVEIEPIKLNEKTISFIPITDPQKFKSLYLKVQDIVTIGIQEGIEPIITKDEDLSKNNANLVSTIPSVCPSCGSPIAFKEIGAFGKCENENCKGNISYKIYTDLNELGIDIIPFDIVSALVKEGYINETTDLCGFCAEDIANIIRSSTEEVETALNIIKYANKAI